MNRMSFGSYLCSLRKKKKLSLAEAAPLVGISISYLMMLEHGGVVQPAYGVCKAIAKAYRIPKKKVLDVFYKDNGIARSKVVGAAR